LKQLESGYRKEHHNQTVRLILLCPYKLCAKYSLDGMRLRLVSVDEQWWELGDV